MALHKIEAMTKISIDLGNALMPISKNSKTPILKNWTSKEPCYSDLTIDGNYGVILKDTDLVVDYDPRNVKDPQAVQSVFDTFRHCITFCVATGGGGYHYYFKKPADFKTNKNIKGVTGLDFLSKGSYVIGPGSIHPSTHKEYAIVLDSDVAQAPDALLELIKRQVTLPTLTIKDLQLDDSEANINSAIRYLETIEPSIQGANGDNRLYLTICTLRDKGLSIDHVKSLIKDYYNPRCVPEWSEEEIDSKISNVFKYAQGSYGSTSLMKLFGSAVEDIKSLDQDFDTKLKDAEDNLEDEFDIDRPYDPINGSINKLPPPQWVHNSEGELTKNMVNLVNYFLDKTSRLYNLVKFNEFTNKIMFNKPAPWHNRLKGLWADDDTIQCKYHLAKYEHYDALRDKIEEAIVTVARYNTYNPCTDWFDSLKGKWDGVPRIDTWLSRYGGAEDTELNRAMGRKTLIGALARAFNPGCKFDYVLVLEGPQGIGKSTAIRALAGAHFYTAIDLAADKDTVDAIQGALIVELDEMSCLERVLAQKLKGFISRTEDNVRLAYRRHSEVFPRRCIFIGTINPERGRGYLKDRTGNRRFWTVACNKFDIQAIHQDREQLWAEAYHIYNKGNEKLWLDTDELETTHKNLVMDRLDADPWESLIIDGMANVYSEDGLKKPWTTDEVATLILKLNIKDITTSTKARIDDIMVKHCQVITHNRNNSTYKNPHITTDD